MPIVSMPQSPKRTDPDRPPTGLYRGESTYPEPRGPRRRALGDYAGLPCAIRGWLIEGSAGGAVSAEGLGEPVPDRGQAEIRDAC